jgi:hypothetical protein
MSEYQYYEFQALDKKLTSVDQTYLQTLSSRVNLSATSASFVYNYGDFRGDPQKVLDRCFDIMLYIANFGTRRLMFRFPKQLIDPAIFAPYCVEDCISVSTTPKSVILDLEFNTDNYDAWIEDDDYSLRDFVTLRDDLLQGDLRVLYLAWLGAGFSDHIDADPEDLIEPPVPPNLKKLSPALKAFTDFFMIDPNLITAAATESKNAQTTTEPIETWIAALPEAERNRYLLRVVNGETRVGTELLLHLREQYGSKNVSAGMDSGRTLAELMAIAEGKRQQRKQKEHQAAAKARKKQLNAIAPKAELLWKVVLELIEQKKSNSYTQAVTHLVNLRDLAELEGDLDTFCDRLQQIIDQYPSRSAFLSRLAKAGLLEE